MFASVGPDPYEQYDSMHKKLIESQKEKEELQRELNRLKDQRDLMRMKNSALNGDKSKSSSSSKAA